MNPTDFLLALAHDSIAAAVLVLLVLATQWVFRKQLSPQWHCALWLLVLIRLVPFSFPSAVSLFNLLPSVAVDSPVGMSNDDRVMPSSAATALGASTTALPSNHSSEHEPD